MGAKPVVMELDATIDDREVLAAFDRMERRAERGRAFFTELKTPAKADIRDHQKRREAPGGTRWPGYALSTRARRRVGRRLLKRLPGILKSYVDEDDLTLRSPVDWAPAHIKGGVAGNGARIPRRDFLWFKREFLEKVKAEFAEFVTKAWER